MKPWTISDLIDFEFFLSADGRSENERVQKRDRGIYLGSVRPRIEEKPQEGPAAYRRMAFMLWLQERKGLFRKEHPAAVLPGEVYSESRSVLQVVVCLVGLLSGAGVALSLLAYTGKEAVNVSMYLGVLVFLQILGLLTMFRFLLLKTSLGTLRKYSLLYLILSRAFERIAGRLMRGAAAGMGGQARAQASASAGLLKGMYAVYGRVLFWPFFLSVQLFGVMFNIGAIGATLIRIFTSDLAFGWQSTLQMSSDTVYAVVKALAAPWTWLLGPYAYPGLEQIEGSRMVLKEGIFSLSTENLVSWWPFLVSAVVVYGLLPRLLLAAAALMGERRSLARLKLGHEACDRLMMRMRSPEVSTGGVPDMTGPHAMPGMQAGGAGLEPLRADMDASALVPGDIMASCSRPELKANVGALLGWDLGQVLAVTGSAGADRPVIQAAARPREGRDLGVVLVQEAWQPPIAETLSLIREIRGQGGREMKIAVMLIGKPSGSTIFTPVRPVDRAVWSKTLAGLGDPFLSIVTAGET